MEFLESIDRAIFLFFNQMHAPWADVMFYFISNQYFWIPLYLVVLFFIAKKWRKRSIVIILSLIACIALTDQTCNLFKNNVKRYRPSHNIELQGTVHLVDYPKGEPYKGGQYGFVSGHAANSIVFAIFSIFFLPGKRNWKIIAFLLWSLVIGYSRIYLGVHYPSDLVGGYMVGLFWSLSAVYLITNVMFPRMDKRGVWLSEQAGEKRP